MSRFRLRESNTPLRARVLPALPRPAGRTPKSLEDGLFHKILVGLEQCDRTPVALLIGAAAMLDAGVALSAGGPVAIAVLGGQAVDAIALSRLAPRGISFGPLKIQWFMLACVRALVACAAVALARLLGGQPGNPAADALLGISLQIAGSALVLRGFHIEPGSLNTSRFELEVASLPPNREMRLLHVADVHVERFGVREQALVALSQETRPDAIVFTGDFLNLSYVHDDRALQDARKLWTALGAAAPVFAVAGSPPVDPLDVVGHIVRGLPVRWLRDEVEDIGASDGCVRLVGVTCTHDPVADGDTLRRVMAQRRGTAGAAPPFTILLHHSPDLAPQAAELGLIDLHLAGHTHGGQVRVPFYGAVVTASLYLKALEMGFYRLHDMLLYVSRGVGLEGKGAPRVRFRCRPQITLFVLRGAAKETQ